MASNDWAETARFINWSQVVYDSVKQLASCISPRQIVKNNRKSGWIANLSNKDLCSAEDFAKARHIRKSSKELFKKRLEKRSGTRLFVEDTDVFARSMGTDHDWEG